jgi:hypothetical protein
MKLVTAGTITELLLSASVSPRKRMNLNLHEPGSPVSRFINAGIAGTYVRPHRHQIDKWELVSVIKGHFDLLIFTGWRPQPRVSECGKRRMPLLATDSGRISPGCPTCCGRERVSCSRSAARSRAGTGGPRA